VGYTFMFALTLVWLLRPSPWRWLALLWPATMLFVVMATANHWWLDGMGGIGASLLALAIVAPLCRSLPRPWRYPERP
jgi:membrane-associated phospholipid phosphatase